MHTLLLLHQGMLVMHECYQRLSVLFNSKTTPLLTILMILSGIDSEYYCQQRVMFSLRSDKHGRPGGIFKQTAQIPPSPIYRTNNHIGIQHTTLESSQVTTYF